MTTRPTVSVDVHNASRETELPNDERIGQWVSAALRYAGASCTNVELSVRFVGESEGRDLNGQYRGKDQATNVLSFPFEEMAGLPKGGVQMLGDLVLCAPVVTQEATAQGKAAADHWAHLVVHGTLHLLGHDHIEDQEAARMEALETNILRSFGIENPYSAN